MDRRHSHWLGMLLLQHFKSHLGGGANSCQDSGASLLEIWTELELDFVRRIGGLEALTREERATGTGRALLLPLPNLSGIQMDLIMALPKTV